MQEKWFAVLGWETVTWSNKGQKLECILWPEASAPQCSTSHFIVSKYSSQKFPCSKRCFVSLILECQGRHLGSEEQRITWKRLGCHHTGVLWQRQGLLLQHIAEPRTSCCFLQSPAFYVWTNGPFPVAPLTAHAAQSPGILCAQWGGEPMEKHVHALQYRL